MSKIKTLGLVFLFSIMGCSVNSNDENQGYEWTGKKTIILSPLQDDIPYEEIVKITNDNLAVKADIDFSDAHLQSIPVMVIDNSTGKVLSEQEISVKIESQNFPVIEVKFPDEAVFPADSFVLEDYVNIYGKYSGTELDYSLPLISPIDLFSGKPGYILYSTDSGEPVSDTVWVPGNYNLTILASDGYGKSIIRTGIEFELN